jgi:4a-hydroxytetrahydrobiopterin dehydratase
MEDIKQEHCIPCRGDEPRLKDTEIEELKKQVPAWEVIHDEGVKKLRRRFKLGSYTLSRKFTNKVADLAEAEDHHPVIVLEYAHVTVTWWTHAINGLHRNDFIMAAKCDDQFNQIKTEK